MYIHNIVHTLFLNIKKLGIVGLNLSFITHCERAQMINCHLLTDYYIKKRRETHICYMQGYSVWAFVYHILLQLL